MRKIVARVLVVTTAAVLVVLAGPSPAHATYTDTTPPPTPDGIGETMVFRATIATRPYAPSLTDFEGPYHCILTYHHYYATPGCGGFSVNVTFSNVRSQPAFIAETPDYTYFHAYADTSRTFGCRQGDGTFDWGSAFVVRTIQTELSAVYVYAQTAYILYYLRNITGDFGPQFYMNFAPVEFSCPGGQTRIQFGLKVTNLKIVIQGSPVFGSRTWHHIGPYYG